MLILADLTVALHLAWLALVIFGVLFTRGRPVWSVLHIFALCWGIAVEAGPWPCPLTLLEQHFETRAGVAAYQGSFLLHILESVLYPNLPYPVVTAAGVAVCAFNLSIYAWRLRGTLRSMRRSV